MQSVVRIVFFVLTLIKVKYMNYGFAKTFLYIIFYKIVAFFNFLYLFWIFILDFNQRALQLIYRLSIDQSQGVKGYVKLV